MLYCGEHGSICLEIVEKSWQIQKRRNLIKKNKGIELEGISNLKENLNSSAGMLGYSSIKSVSGRDKIDYGKRKLAEICDAAKGETWNSIECRRWQNFLNHRTYMSVSFLKWPSFSQTSRK